MIVEAGRPRPPKGDYKRTPYEYVCTTSPARGQVKVDDREGFYYKNAPAMPVIGGGNSRVATPRRTLSGGNARTVRCVLFLSPEFRLEFKRLVQIANFLKCFQVLRS